MDGKALGLIETYGYIGAIEAADVCLKAANVRLIGVELVGGGLVTVKINGETGAVKAAIDAAGASVGKIGKLISTHMIPRPASGISKLLYDALEVDKSIDCKSADCESAESQTAEDIQQQNAEVKKNETTEHEEIYKKKEFADIEEKLKTMKVVEMRVFARGLEGLEMERNHIKFAKREELIEAILDYYGIGDIE